MRFVWAVVALVLATVMIGTGIAQRTVFQGPGSITTEITADGNARYLVIDGAVFRSQPGAQTLRVTGDGTVFAAYGRTSDVTAWLSDVSYDTVVLGDDGTLTTNDVSPAPIVTPATATSATAPATAPSAAPESTRNPAGSDLWLDEFQQDGMVLAPLQLPDNMSVIVASDGVKPAPHAVSITWPIENSTPWAGPLIVAGAFMMVVGLVLYVLGWRHVRRARGPRRKGLPLPVTEPIDIAIDDEAKGVISAGKARASLTRGRRSFLVAPAALVGLALLSGCSADAWPQAPADTTPSPTVSVIVPESQQQPAVTTAQAEHILAEVAQTVAQADEAKNPDLVATRLGGAMLAQRKTNYTLRNAISDYPAAAPITTGVLEVVLPQAFDSWPRSFLAVVNNDTGNTSSIMVLSQQDPWSQYKLVYSGDLGASTLMPKLAPSYIGATQLQPDSPFVMIPPDEVAAAYADVLDKGENSQYASLFESDGDAFRTGVAADRQKRLDEFNQTASETGSLTFSSSAGDQPPFAIATLESGAIVAVNLFETDTVKPTNADAVIKLDGNDRVKTLAGADQSATGFSTTFSDQLFFYVPGPSSTDKIRLLGYSSEILKGSVL